MHIQIETIQKINKNENETTDEKNQSKNKNITHH